MSGDWLAAAPGLPRAGSVCKPSSAQGREPAPARGQPQGARAQLREALLVAHEAWRTTARIRLGLASAAPEASFATGPMPAFKNIQFLSTSDLFAGADIRAIFRDVSMPTALEKADGNWESAVLNFGGLRMSASVEELAEAFDTHIAPSRARPRTRSGHWRNWSIVVTWSVVRKTTLTLMPMPLNTLKALTMDLVTLAASRSQIEAVWAAVQARHRLFGLAPPLLGRGEYTAWSRSLGTIMGRPLSLKLPIHKTVVARLLRWRPESLVENRARLLTALATLACLRVSEVARLQVCDLWFDWHAGWGVPGYHGTCAVHVAHRKNDAERKGHHPALGRSVNRDLDIVTQLRVWMQWTGLRVQPGCPKRERPAAACPICPPLFPRTQKGRGDTTRVTNLPCCPQRVSAIIKGAAEAAGCCGARFSGISARKGGLSTAIEARVDECILYLQSGHAPDKAARRYMHLRDPARLFETFEAFEL